MATYTQFDETRDTVNTIDRVFASAWTNNTNELFQFHSSSTQYVQTTPSSSGNYFMEIYNENPQLSSSTAEVQFSIAYGHKEGSGSANLSSGDGGDGFSATKAIYNQYRNLVFGGDETQNFTFGTHTPDDIYVININRARYKNAIRLGNLDLHLQYYSGSVSAVLSAGNTDTGSIIRLTDDSVSTTGSAAAIRAGVGREFNLVSGSAGVIASVSHSGGPLDVLPPPISADNVTSTFQQLGGSGSYGLVYPDVGLIIINPDALALSASAGGIDLISSASSNSFGNNSARLQRALNNAANGEGGLTADGVTTNGFVLDSQEDISSKFYFVRAFNTDFNHSTNDSFTENDGTLKFDSMIDNPKVYITTVGLYNDNQDLLAVAKLSQPLPKNFTKEALIKVKLDY
tara:strand:- start:757 stop:1959 length:1203 start_codon:yes stop_codon:yes gene_type:complete